MAVEIHGSVSVDDVNSAMERVISALRNDKCKIEIESGNRVVATRGSQVKTRSWGAHLVNLKVLPVRLQVDFDKGPASGIINFSGHSDFGFGTILGAVTKFEDAVRDILNVATTAAALGVKVPDNTLVPSSDISPSKAFCLGCGLPLGPEAKFCGGCGQAA
jgi:hypothetical protein